MTPFVRSWARRAREAGFAALVLAAACGGEETSLGGPAPAEDETTLQVSVITFDVVLSRLVAEVSASDIPVPLVFNLTLNQGSASGTLRLPPGLARTITLRAYDSQGGVSHEGSAIVNVRPGMNPSVTIPLRPRAGQVPITATIGSIGLVLVPGSASVGLDQTRSFLASLTTGVPGQETALDPFSVTWAVTDPTLGRIGPDGVFAPFREGTLFVVATYEGIAAVSEVAVVAPFTTVVRGNLRFGALGAPVPNARISVEGAETRTDADGRYLLGGVTARDLVLVVDELPPGCSAFDVILQLEPGTVLDLDLTADCD